MPGKAPKPAATDRVDEPARVFVSYARTDEPVAREVEAALLAEGCKVWRDDQLAAHRAFAEEIDERLRESHAVVVVWTGESARSDWVRAEADFARKAGKLVQLSADGAPLPLPFDQIHCATLTGWAGDRQAPGWRKVADSVRALSGQSPSRMAAEPGPRSVKPSLAVLPFANFCRDPDQDYFVEGMMDEVVTALTRIRSLFVIASRASYALEAEELTLADASRRLGVRYILEGSVRRAGDKVRIAVMLSDAHAGGQVWAERFDGTLEDVFALQDHVALSVAGVLEPAVLNAEARKIARRPLESLGAYDLYLRAASLRATLRRNEVLEALDLLERALGLEPDFAPALAQAAGCHSQILLNRWAEDISAHRREGLRLAERAAQSGADDPTALAQAANAVLDLGGDMKLASALIERALALNPGSAFAHLVCGFVRIFQGEAAAAMPHLEQAIRLDPVSHARDVATAHIGICKGLLGEYAEAARIIGETTHRPPRIRLALAAIHGHLGQFEQARREIDLYQQSSDVPVAVMVRLMELTPIHARLTRGITLVRADRRPKA